MPEEMYCPNCNHVAYMNDIVFGVLVCPHCEHKTEVTRIEDAEGPITEEMSCDAL